MGTIKSIDVQGKGIDHELVDHPRDGSMRTGKLTFELDTPDPLLTVPANSMQEKIYWGATPASNGGSGGDREVAGGRMSPAGTEAG